MGWEVVGLSEHTGGAKRGMGGGRMGWGRLARDSGSQGLEGLLGAAPLGTQPEDRHFVREP
jgi:hypothetical protein